MSGRRSQIAQSAETVLRFTPVLLALMGIVASATILSSVFWFTAQIEKTAAKGDRAVAQSHLEEAVEDVRNSVVDYAHWTLAYDIVQAGDVAQINEHLGSGAVESDLFDQIFILSSELRLLHEFHSDGANDSRFSAIENAFQPFLSALKATAPKDYDSVSGFAQLNGQFAAVSTSWVTPDIVSEVEMAGLPILVGVTYLDAAWIERLERYALTDVHTTATISAPKDSSFAMTPLLGPLGEQVGHLQWSLPNVGDALRRDMMRPIVLACVAALLATVLTIAAFNSYRNALETLRIEATTDHLTCLMNRSGLDQTSASDLTRLALAECRLALIYIDLDGFKELNDHHGHEIGDLALQHIAEIIRKAVRETDDVARIGGDEFVCVVRDNDPRGAAVRIAQEIATVARQPVNLAETPITLSVSSGIAVAGNDATWNALLSQSDAAMYMAKRQGSHLVIYGDQLQAQSTSGDL